MHVCYTLKVSSIFAERQNNQNTEMFSTVEKHGTTTTTELTTMGTLWSLGVAGFFLAK